MELVHWPLMGGLSHLVQRGGDWSGSILSGSDVLHILIFALVVCLKALAWDLWPRRSRTWPWPWELRTWPCPWPYDQNLKAKALNTSLTYDKCVTFIIAHITW